MKRRTVWLIALVIAVYAAFNLNLYFLVTVRLANNFSDTSQAKMIEVADYLPHQNSPKLPHIETDFKLADNLPVLDGATALLPVYAAVIEAVYPAGSVTFEGGEFSDVGFYGENFAADSVMQYKNTVRGYQAIVDGDTDILFCAAPSAEQLAYAESKGVKLVFQPIGQEAFVFFVNRHNPVDNLTTEQVRAIYAGEYTNWRQVGGINRVINPVSRLAGSGSQTTMEKFMGEKQIGGKSPFALTGAAIGFSFRYYLEGIVADGGVKMLSLNGVYPSAENIALHKYPLVSEFYAIYREDNDNPNIAPLLGWLLSAEGQDLIEQCGYVRLFGAEVEG